MKIRSVRHKGLKALLEDDDPKGLRGDQVSRVRRILSALLVARDMAEVSGPPGWRIHQLTGDRAGTWSISLTGNWRITFDLDLGGPDADGISNLNLEDYH